jgi:gliding motility-associated lipoprotein GldH
MIKGISKHSFVIILIFLFLLPSCDSKVVYTESRPIPEQTWKLADIPLFKIPVNDTINSNNIFFIIRTGLSYPFRNIYLFVTAMSPGGKTITDTLQYQLTDEKGNWSGKGFGGIHELKLLYRSNVYFPVKGIYQFKIQHGMRVEDLKGVYDFGLRIEKVSK